MMRRDHECALTAPGPGPASAPRCGAYPTAATASTASPVSPSSSGYGGLVAVEATTTNNNNSSSSSSGMDISATTAGGGNSSTGACQPPFHPCASPLTAPGSSHQRWRTPTVLVSVQPLCEAAAGAPVGRGVRLALDPGTCRAFSDDAAGQRPLPPSSPGDAAPHTHLLLQPAVWCCASGADGDVMTPSATSSSHLSTLHWGAAAAELGSALTHHTEASGAGRPSDLPPRSPMWGVASASAAAAAEESAEAKRMLVTLFHSSRKFFLDNYYTARAAHPSQSSSPGTASLGSPSHSEGSSRAAFSARVRLRRRRPELNYSRILCPEGEEALHSCIHGRPAAAPHGWRKRGTSGGSGGDDAALAPMPKALRNVAAMSFGPFSWGSTRDQCLWIYEKLHHAVSSGAPATVLRALVTVLHLFHHGSMDMLAVVGERQDELFDAQRMQRRGFTSSHSPDTTLMYVFSGFIASLADFLYTSATKSPDRASEADVAATAAAEGAERASDGERSRSSSPDGSGHQEPLPSAGAVSRAKLGSTHSRGGRGSSGRASVASTAASGADTSLWVMTEGQPMLCNVLKTGSYERWLPLISRSQRHRFLLAIFELIKGATTIQHLDLYTKESITPLAECVIAKYVDTLRALFACCATMLDEFFTTKDNTYFGDNPPEPGAHPGAVDDDSDESEEGGGPSSGQLRRVEEWCLAVVGYENTVWRLSKFFAWAASLNLRATVIPKLQPLPDGFLAALERRLMRYYTGSLQRETVSAVLVSVRRRRGIVAEPALSDTMKPAEEVASTTLTDSSSGSSGTCAPTGEAVSNNVSSNGDTDTASAGPRTPVPAAPPERASTAVGNSESRRSPASASLTTTLARQDSVTVVVSGSPSFYGGGGRSSRKSFCSSRSLRPLDLSNDFYGPPAVSTPRPSEGEAEEEEEEEEEEGGSTDAMSRLVNRRRNQTFMILADEANCSSANDIERFRVFRKHVLGRGSFGTVYKCWDDVQGGFLACKELCLDPDTTAKEETMAAVFREYSLLTSLRHPNIVAVIGFIVENVRGRIMMEWMPSGSVESVLNLVPEGLREHVVRRFIRDALCGLEYLHSKGIVHRDVKPGNMLLDGRGVLKLTDFGSSRSVLQDGAAEGVMSLKTLSVVGTLAYIAPDSLQGYCGFASDIWAIGCSAIHMATGSPPWRESGAESVALIFKIGSLKDGEHLPPIRNREKFSPDFLAFVEAALTFDRCKRPTASELLQHPFIRNGDLETDTLQ